MPPNLYVYRIVTDGGAAPHISNNYLTLTICKPGVRKSAAVGDYILALVALQHKHLTGSNDRRFYKAAYLFKVTEKVTMSEYEGWCKSHAPGKVCTEDFFEGDCQYNSALRWRPGPHGPGEERRNLSGKYSLVSEHYAPWTSAKAHSLTDEEIDSIGLDREQVQTATRNFFRNPLSPSQVEAVERLISAHRPAIAPSEEGSTTTTRCGSVRACGRGGARRTRRIRKGSKIV